MHTSILSLLVADPIKDSMAELCVFFSDRDPRPKSFRVQEQGIDGIRLLIQFEVVRDQLNNTIELLCGLKCVQKLDILTANKN
jgi:hypothetical protein